MFEKSESIVEITRALVEFHKTVPAIKKGEQNPFFKSKYADLSSIIETVEPHLTKNNLSFSSFPIGENELLTILSHASGEFMMGAYKMTPSKNDPQGIGSAITYQKRYALAAILGLKLGDEDDDANEASRNKKGKQAEMSASERYDKAKKMISDTEDKKILKEWRVNIESSKMYAKAPKDNLLKMIDEKLNKK